MPPDPLIALFAYSGHELRTPLTSLALAVEMCADGSLGPLTSAQRETLAGAVTDCARLCRLIEALTDPVLVGDSARVTRGAVDLGKVLSAAIDAAQSLASERGVIITASQVPTSLANVVGDAERLTRVIVHGLNHALAGARRASLLTAAATGDGIAITWQAAADAAPRTMELWLCERLLGALGGTVDSSDGRLMIRVA